MKAQKNVNLSERGFTLVEFLVAIVIMMVGLLGLLQMVNYAILHNTTNQLRQDALILGDELMNLELSKTFDRISSPSSFDPELSTYERNFIKPRIINGVSRDYTVIKKVTDVTKQVSKNVEYQITWQYKGQTYAHSVVSLVAKYR